MTAAQPLTLDPILDLMVERVVRVSPQRAWAAWTDALLQPQGDATLCTTLALHRSDVDRNHHAEMGFYDGRGTVFDQLGAYAPTM